MQKLPVCWVCPDTVYDWEGNLALGEIFTEALARRVSLSSEVLVIIANLENCTEEIC